MKYRCPLCGSALTERHYHEVVKAQARKEKIHQGEVGDALAQGAAAGA